MEIACEVRRVLSRQPEKIQPNDFKLKFSFKTGQQSRQSSEEWEKQTALAKGRWFAHTGYKAQNS